MSGASSGRARRSTPAGAFDSGHTGDEASFAEHGERAHPVSERVSRSQLLLDREPRKSDIEALTGPHALRESDLDPLTVPPAEYPMQNLPGSVEEAVLQAIEQNTHAPSSPELPAAAYVKRTR